MRRLILKSFLSPGDIVMLTAAVRELHRAHPRRFLTDVRTSAPQLWENNPHLTSLDEDDPRVRVIDMHYPLIQRSNQAPYHFIHGYVQHLEQQLGLKIPVSEFKGDIHLAGPEKCWMSQVAETGFRGAFWIMMAGGKFDFTAKWWDPAAYQQVVDHFRGRILFVQCGERHHFHPPLKGVLNLIGKTDIRQFVRLMHHADGVVSPVTFAMHLAAAVPVKPGKPKNRACVVIAGGREPPHWEAYPHHQYISTNGALDCCDNGGCWKSRCQTLGDGDEKDANLCAYPVQVAPEICIPKCLAMITPADVIRRIELYFDGGALQYNTALGAPHRKPRRRRRAIVGSGARH
jgi:ADP-heptose:LPS heptosyltransferase